jgi:hypothetical protein
MSSELRERAPHDRRLLVKPRTWSLAASGRTQGWGVLSVVRAGGGCKIDPTANFAIAKWLSLYKRARTTSVSPKQRERWHAFSFAIQKRI